VVLGLSMKAKAAFAAAGCVFGEDRSGSATIIRGETGS
jgi:hypothetical protein